MRRLRKFLRLRISERWLLIKAGLLLGVIRLGLWLLPFQTLRRLLSRLATLTTRRGMKADPTSIERVTWAVEAVGRNVPRIGTCLTQALAAQALLARRDYPTRLHIGVTRGVEGRLQAHAWLGSGSEILIGGSELERYATLVALDGEKP